MAQLDISTFSGHLKTVELDKRQALSIGAHPSNDVQLEGDDVEIMHCRISWNKTGFEVVAAGGDGVDLNGTFVQKAQLSAGDVLRIGEADIKFSDGAEPAKEDGEKSTFGLKPLTGEIEIPPPASEAPAEDEPLTADEIAVDDPPATKRSSPDREKRSRERKEQERRERKRERAAREERKRGKARKREPELHDADEFDLESLAEEAQPADKPKKKAIQRTTDAAADEAFDEQEESEEESPPTEKLSLKQRLHSRPQRPGERDALRSPLVLTLGGGAAVLVLLGLTFYFIINRQTTRARFDAAKALMDEGKYNQAVGEFDQFIALFPRDSLVDEAKVLLGISKIEQHISLASPKWKEGKLELDGFINARRDLPDFEDHRDGIRRRAEQIAEGAAITAGEVFDRELLAVSDDAKALLTRFSPEGEEPTDALKRIQSAWRASDAAILKHETLLASIAAIDKAIEEKRPMDALVERRHLIRKYPDFENDKRIVEKLAETLATEQELVARDDQPVDAVTDEHPSDVPTPLTLAFHARSRTDEVSVGENVYAVSKDCCYAIDTITGQPVWRRVIGSDAPFFPVTVNASAPALLVYSTRYGELQLVTEKTGALLWRQPAVKDVTGPPTIDEGQAYLLSSGGTLYKVDIASGQVTSRLTFSQKVQAPAAAVLDGTRMVIAGSQEVVYTVTKRPLECVAVTYFGHPPESVVAPLLPMGALVLMCENQPGETALLRVLDTRDGDQLTEIDAAEIPGHVVDAPVIRGRDVFVPSSGERVSSFSASDEPGQKPLTVGPRDEPERAVQSTMYLATGPDRIVWMASRTLRQLQLTTDAIQQGSMVVNIGIAMQPIQLQGRKLYIGRTQPYSSATTLFQTDREELTSDWQTVVGGRLLAWGSYPDQEGLVAVNETGDVFRISGADLSGSGFLSTSTIRLNLPEGLEDQLGARQLADGQIAVWCGDPQPQLWLINRVGQTNRPVPLPAALECPPILLGGRILVATAGELHLLRTKSGEPNVQPFSQPQAQEGSPRWKQLVPVDESTLLAATESGTIYQVRLQTSPQAFLAESGTLELGEPLSFRLAADAGMLALATGSKLQVLDAATLEPRGETELPGPVSNDVWMVGQRVFVETGRQELQMYDSSAGLAEAKTLALEGVPVAGAPLAVAESFVVCRRDGRVVILNAATGEISGEVTIGQSLDGGPQRIGGFVLAATIDGSLVQIGSQSSGP